MKRRFLALGVAMALVPGCGTMIDSHSHIEGWPDLKVVEHHVSNIVMREKCSKYVSVGLITEACMEADLVKSECHIWYSAEFPPSESVREHEQLHCKGYDHPGSDSLRNYFFRWKAWKEAQRVH